MNLRIANTFTDSLAKLNGEEQRAVKTTAFDLQLNPANVGTNFHNSARDYSYFTDTTHILNTDGPRLGCHYEI
jgi:hypothetical protein